MLPHHFTKQLPVPLLAPVADLGERGERREASSALPLHFTTKIPVPLTAPMAHKGERGGRRETLSVLCLLCIEMPFPQLAPMARIMVKAHMLLLLLLLVVWPSMASYLRCHLSLHLVAHLGSFLHSPFKEGRLFYEAMSCEHEEERDMFVGRWMRIE